MTIFARQGSLRRAIARHVTEDGSSAAEPMIRRCERAIAAAGGELSERDIQIPGESDEESMNAIVREAQRADAAADFEAGVDLFRHGAFPEAAASFGAANAESGGNPALVFDIARANQQAGNLEEAISGFRRYLGIGG